MADLGEIVYPCMVYFSVLWRSSVAFLKLWLECGL